MPNATLLDIAKLNGHDRVAGLMEAVAGVAPEVDAIPARTIKGTCYDTVLRTSYPTVQFRGLNGGIDASKSRFETRKVQCFLLSCRVVVDRAAAMSFEDGIEAFQNIEATGVMEAAKIELGKQVFSGTSEDDKGFPGLNQIVSEEMTVDAGGTTPATGSSVYAARLGAQGVQFVLGMGSGFTLGSWVDGDGEDEAGRKFPAFIGNLSSWVGLQCTNPNAVARLKRLTAETGKGVTDARLQELLDKFPAGRLPNVFFMSRRSASQLQKSRTVVLMATPTRNVSGAVGAMADWPTNAFGIPIVVTDSILNTEALS